MSISLDSTSLVLQDGTSLGPESVKVDLSGDFPRYRFVRSLPVPLRKMGMVPVKEAFTNLYEMMKSCPLDASVRYDLSFPLPRSSANRVLSLSLLNSELAVKLSSRMKSTFRNFILNKKIDWEEATAPANLNPSQFWDLNSTDYVEFVKKKTLVKEARYLGRFLCSDLKRPCSE